MKRFSEDVRVRLQRGIKRQVEREARREGRSMSQWIRRAVELALTLRKKQEAELET